MLTRTPWIRVVRKSLHPCPNGERSLCHVPPSVTCHLPLQPQTPAFFRCRLRLAETKRKTSISPLPFPLVRSSPKGLAFLLFVFGWGRLLLSGCFLKPFRSAGTRISWTPRSQRARHQPQNSLLCALCSPRPASRPPHPRPRLWPWSGGHVCRGAAC